MTHIAPLVALVVLLLSRTASGSGFFCTWTKVTPDQRVHYSFLRSDPPSLRLYHSVWSGGERALLGCTWSDDAALIQDYRSLCRERAHDFSDHLDPLLDSVMEAEKEQCVSLAALQGHAGRRPVRSVREREDERSEVTIHQRVKRGFIVPGTLWCGSGNKAPSYADLGVFSDTDSCCREHDQCKDTILSFHSEFGVFNSNIFTMSHCDCDNKFHSCLKDANDSIAHVVGYTFFNLLKMHCFRFSHRLQCTQRNWFGMCKETKMALYAEVYPPTLFESIDPADLNTNSSINSTTAPAALLETSEPQLSSITAPTPGAFLSTSTQRRDDTESTTKRTTTVNRDSSAETSCSVYKDLDECRTKIRPQQKKYGLHNTEMRTLYHCNCTSRLFQSLTTQRQLSKVQSVLLGQVSPSCFLLQDCSAANSCSAVLLKANLPQLNVEEQHHLQAVTLKVRRPNTRRARRRDRAVRLHKLCVRMSRASIQSPQSPAAGTERAE